MVLLTLETPCRLEDSEEILDCLELAGEEMMHAMKCVTWTEDR